MRGFPDSLNTKRDVFNMVDYAASHPECKARARAALERIRDDVTYLKIKRAAVKKSPADLTLDDYEAVPNKHCFRNRVGLTDDEIASLIRRC